MGTLPRATTTADTTASAVSAGADTICIWSPVATNDDCTPRIFGTAVAALAFHGYCEGAEYAALHVDGTKKSFAFVGLPIATPGVVGREDTSGNTGTSVTSLAEGGDGVLAEHDGVLTVIQGGTVATDQIILGLSLDGGLTTKRIRLGTATSYAIPYVGVTVSLTVGTLVAGDVVHVWHGTAPKSDASGWALARAAMASQLRQYRSVILCGDLINSTEANAYLDQLNSYATSNDRFVYGRASVRDREPQAEMSVTRIKAAGVFNATFAEVGETGDTIARSAGSFVTDGFLDTDYITVDGSTLNGGVVRGLIGAGGVAAAALTLGTTDLVAEGPIAGVTIYAVGRVTFDLSDRTAVRTRGSWVDDGFRVGDLVDVDGSVSNDATDLEILTVTDSTITFVVGTTLVDESIAADLATITAGQAKAAWMANIDAAFAAVSGMRIDLSAGRARKMLPIAGWAARLPAAWAASVREYQHAVHIPAWRKEDGPLSGWDLFDEDGDLVEWDDRVDGGAGCLARFTTFRTWGNGPNGAFIALALTRADENLLVSLTHNVAVVNLACTTVQTLSENAIGRVGAKNEDGTATAEFLASIASDVNNGLQSVLLSTGREGPRCSDASWEPNTDDDLSVPDATLTGVLTLNLNGTIHSVDTVVRVI